MFSIVRAAVVFLGVLAAIAAVGYASLVAWEREHPPRLPGYEKPVLKAPRAGG